MKRQLIVLTLILIVGMLALGCQGLSPPNSIPHENPAVTTAASLDTTELLLFYSDMFSTGADRRYQDAQDMLEELSALDFTGELKYVTDRYNHISEELFIALNQTEFNLNEASDLFAKSRLDAAREVLTKARAALQNARLLVTELETSIAFLIEQLPVQLDSAASQFNQARQKLQTSMQRLNQLADELERLSQHLEERPDADITTRFYHPTSLDISAPDTIYPGLPFTVIGRVQSDYSNVERTIRVLFEDSELARNTAQGHFTLELTVPPHTSTGEHDLTVQVVAQGDYTGATKSQHITVLRLPVQCEIRSPRLVVTPQDIMVTGNVRHKHVSIPDASINLSFKDSSAATRTDSHGNFAVTVHPTTSIETITAANPFYATTAQTLPLNLSLFGWQVIAVTIDPAEPWYAPVKLTRQTFVINPINSALMLALLFSLSLFVYRRSRSGIPETDISSSLSEELPSVTPLNRLKTDFSGTNQRILSSYQNGLNAIEKASGISMTAPSTLREFLNAVSPRLTTAASLLFAKLTDLAELVLYSPRQPDEDAAIRAEQLAASLKKETHYGTL